MQEIDAHMVRYQHLMFTEEQKKIQMRERQIRLRKIEMFCEE